MAKKKAGKKSAEPTLSAAEAKKKKLWDTTLTGLAGQRDKVAGGALQLHYDVGQVVLEAENKDGKFGSHADLAALRKTLGEQSWDEKKLVLCKRIAKNATDEDIAFFVKNGIALRNVNYYLSISDRKKRMTMAQDHVEKIQRGEMSPGEISKVVPAANKQAREQKKTPTQRGNQPAYPFKNIATTFESIAKDRLPPFVDAIRAYGKLADDDARARLKPEAQKAKKAIAAMQKKLAAAMKVVEGAGL
jgi:hypothetical protein